MHLIPQWQMLLIDLENNYYSTSSLFAIVIQIIVMMLDRFLYWEEG